MWLLALTHCVARDEIPCLTWREAGGAHECFLFALVLHAERAELRAVTPTH